MTRAAAMSTGFQRLQLVKPLLQVVQLVGRRRRRERPRCVNVLHSFFHCLVSLLMTRFPCSIKFKFCLKTLFLTEPLAFTLHTSYCRNTHRSTTMTRAAAMSTQVQRYRFVKPLLQVTLLLQLVGRRRRRERPRRVNVLHLFFLSVAWFPFV